MHKLAPAVQAVKHSNVPAKLPNPAPASNISTEAPGKPKAASSICKMNTATEARSGWL